MALSSFLLKLASQQGATNNNNNNNISNVQMYKHAMYQQEQQ